MLSVSSALHHIHDDELMLSEPFYGEEAAGHQLLQQGAPLFFGSNSVGTNFLLGGRCCWMEEDK